MTEMKMAIHFLLVMNSQKLWLPAYDWAHQYSIMDRWDLPLFEELLATDGCCRRENHFKRLWLNPGVTKLTRRLDSREWKHVGRRQWKEWE